MPVKAKPISPDFFNFDEGTIHKIAQEFNLPGIDEFYPILLDGESASLLEVRSETSRKMVVGSSTSDNKYFLKQIPWYCDDTPLVRFSHSVQKTLYDAGLPVAGICQTRDDNSWLDINDIKFVLFEHIEGRRYTGTPEQISSSATALAEINKCAFMPLSDEKPEDQFSFVRDHIVLLQSVDKDAGNYKEEIRVLSAILDKTEADCIADGWDKLPRGIVHGDYCPWNLLFKKDGSLKTVVDFDNTTYGSRLQDLSEALITFAFMDYKKDSTNFIPITKNSLDMTKASTFLEAYTAVEPLSQAESRCLPHLIKATMIELFCLGLVRKDIGKESWKPIIEALDNITTQINSLTKTEEKQYASKIPSRSFDPS